MDKRATIGVVPELCDELGISPPTAYALVKHILCGLPPHVRFCLF